MSRITEIAEAAHRDFEARTLARDAALTRSRALIRHSANAIRAIHRGESELAHEHLTEGRTIVDALKSDLAVYPDLYYTTKMPLPSQVLRVVLHSRPAASARSTRTSS